MYTYSDGKLLYFKDSLEESYLVEHIIPSLQASKFRPVANPSSAGGEVQQHPLLVLPWLGASGSSAGRDVASSVDRTYVIIVDTLGVHTPDDPTGPLKHTVVYSEVLAFLGVHDIHSAGLVTVVCFLYHTSPAARLAFEVESGLKLGSFCDYLCLASIPDESATDSLGMTLLVRTTTGSPAPSPSLLTLSASAILSPHPFGLHHYLTLIPSHQ